MPKGEHLKAKKGEPGYHERNTTVATEAAREVCAIFLSGAEFTAAADKYFDECDERDEMYGEAGLCLGLTKYNPRGKATTLASLRKWYDDDDRPDLQEAVQLAYLRIQRQIETDPRYQEKGGMATRGIFLQKQKRFGGYQDKIEQKTDTTVTIVHGASMDESDFK